MANKIYIEYKILNSTFDKAKKEESKQLSAFLSTKKTLEIPMTSDITIEAVSNWQAIGDFIPDFLNKTISLMTNLSAAGGGVSEGLVGLQNKLQVPMWQSSPPVKISVQLGFFTKTSAYNDVFDPVTELVGLSILSRDPDNDKRFITPGISLANLNDFSAKGGEKKISKKSKLISFEIPGVVYLPLAMVESARPTFSQEVTESSYPLWATVDLNIIGASPASTDMFTEAISSDLRMVKKIEYGFDKIKSIFT